MNSEPEDVYVRVVGLESSEAVNVVEDVTAKFPDLQLEVVGDRRLFPPLDDQALVQFLVGLTGPIAYRAFTYLLERLRNTGARVDLRAADRLRVAEAFLLFDADVSDYGLLNRTDTEDSSVFVFESDGETHKISVSRDGNIQYRRQPR